MKKVLFVINTLGGAGAERALLELLKRFTPDQYEVDLYILLEQGEADQPGTGICKYFEQKLYSRVSSFRRGKEEIEQKSLYAPVYAWGVV